MACAFRRVSLQQLTSDPMGFRLKQCLLTDTVMERAAGLRLCRFNTATAVTTGGLGTLKEEPVGAWYSLPYGA